MDKIKVAIIGCGTIANAAHMPGYRAASDLCEVKYFCDIIPERAVALRDKYGSGIANTDYHEILSDPEVTCVSICVPNGGHAPIAIDFLKAGKHVLCEKPAAMNSDLAREMQKTADECGRILNIGVCNRFNTAVEKIEELISQGELGNIYHIYCSFRAYRSIPGLGGDFTTFAASGGGSLIDWGVHYLDLVEYVCGSPDPLTVSGEVFSKLGSPIKDYLFTHMWASQDYNVNGTYDVDDSVTGLIRTTGPVISFNGAWAENIKDGGTFIDFMGTKGGIHHDYCGGFTLYTQKDGMLLTTTPEFRMKEMHREEVLDFIRCVRAHERNRNDIAEAIKTSRIMQAVYDSSESHREITLA